MNWNQPVDFPEWNPPSMEELFGMTPKNKKHVEIDDDVKQNVSELITQLKQKKANLDKQYAEDLQHIKNEIHRQIEELI